MSEPQNIRSSDVASVSSVLGDPDVVVRETAPEPPPTEDQYRVPPEALKRADARTAALQQASLEGFVLVNSISKEDVDYLVLRDDTQAERSFRVEPDGSLIEEEAPQPTSSAQPEETLTVEGE